MWRRKKKKKDIIQKAIKRPGRVKRYMMRLYGEEAFYSNGEIKPSYIKKTIKMLKERPRSKRPPGMISALYFALRLKKWAKKRTKKGKKRRRG